MRGVADNLARLAAGSSSARDQTVALSASEEGPTAGEIDQVPTHDLSSPKTGPATASGHDTPAALAPESLDQRSTQPRRNRVVAAAVAVIALIGVGILIAAMLPDDRKAIDPVTVPDQSTSAAPESTKLSTAPRSATSSAAAPRASSTARRDPPPTATPRTGARTPSRAPSPTTAPTVRATPTAAQLRQAITNYYALMPRNTDAAWPRMTASYQTNHAGGRQAYQRFWDAVDRISVADVRGMPPNAAQATITYYFKDGRVVRERTAYGLINDRGRLKINSTTVLSSVTL